MAKLNVNNVRFVRSAAREDQFIRTTCKKIVFAGKSNVGKSSVINRMLNRRNFARVGSEPGKTVHINYFLIDEKIYFVDLPGYGYAKVSSAEKERWARLMETFFQNETVDLGVLIVDSRHRPTQDDCMMSSFLQDTGCPFVVVANKTDKLKKTQIEANLQLIRDTLEIGAEVPVIPFSAEKGEGKNELFALIQSCC